MNWEEVGAIGQVLGSVAVLVTLGYLAVQVRHANYELRRSISQDRANAVLGLFMAQAADEQFVAIFANADAAFGGVAPPFVTAVTERAGLTRDQAWRLFSEIAWLNYRSQVFQYIDELSAADRALFENGIRLTYGRGVARVFYETTIKTIADPEFVRYIDNLLAQPG